MKCVWHRCNHRHSACIFYVHNILDTYFLDTHVLTQICNTFHSIYNCCAEQVPAAQLALGAEAQGGESSRSGVIRQHLAWQESGALLHLVFESADPQPALRRIWLACSRCCLKGAMFWRPFKRACVDWCSRMHSQQYSAHRSECRVRVRGNSFAGVPLQSHCRPHFEPPLVATPNWQGIKINDSEGQGPAAQEPSF